MTRRISNRTLILGVCAALGAAAPGWAQDEAPPPAAIITGGGAPAPAPTPTPAPAPAAAPTPAPAPAPAPAAAAPAPATAGAPAWRVDCFGEAEARQCAALQEIGVETDGQLQRLLTVMVQSDGADGESLILALPHGLLFPAGVQVSVDGGAATPVTVQTSDVSGAYGGATLTPELAASMRAGTEMQVSFVSVDQERMAVPVTLTGFSAAYDMRQQGVATPAE